MARKLAKRSREQVPVMRDLAEEIERQLDLGDFDRADPSLEPALGSARRCAGHLKRWLSEIAFLVETEHE